MVDGVLHVWFLAAVLVDCVWEEVLKREAVKKWHGSLASDVLFHFACSSVALCQGAKLSVSVSVSTRVQSATARPCARLERIFLESSKAPMKKALPLHHVRAPVAGSPPAAASSSTSCSSQHESPPLLLLLHGTGDNEYGLTQLANLAPKHCVVASLRAPLNAPFGGFRWFEGYSAMPEQVALKHSIPKSCDELFDFIQKAPAHFGTNPNKTFLLGFSQGATIGWASLVSRWPRAGFIAGAALVSGRLMPQFFEANTTLNSRLAQRDQLRNVPVFASHGALDPVTPVRVGRENKALFYDFGGQDVFDFRYFEDPSSGHDIPASVAVELRSWLDDKLS